MSFSRFDELVTIYQHTSDVQCDIFGVVFIPGNIPYLIVYRLRQIFEVEHSVIHSFQKSVYLHVICSVKCNSRVRYEYIWCIDVCTMSLWRYYFNIYKNSKGMVEPLFWKYYFIGILICYEKDVTTDGRTDRLIRPAILWQVLYIIYFNYLSQQKKVFSLKIRNVPLCLLISIHSLLPLRQSKILWNLNYWQNIQTFNKF